MRVVRWADALSSWLKRRAVGDSPREWSDFGEVWKRWRIVLYSREWSDFGGVWKWREIAFYSREWNDLTWVWKWMGIGH